MIPFDSLRNYETFIYTLPQQYPSIRRATLVVAPRGQRVGVLHGELQFDHGYRISIRERISWERGIGFIESYSYELWHNTDKIAWYDPQPHPNEPTLASTHPHHKHVPSDIKHHCVPAPGLSFTQPNLPLLIQEIETLISARSDKL